MDNHLRMVEEKKNELEDRGKKWIAHLSAEEGDEEDKTTIKPTATLETGDLDFILQYSKFLYEKGQYAGRLILFQV